MEGYIARGKTVEIFECQRGGGGNGVVGALRWGIGDGFAIVLSAPNVGDIAVIAVGRSGESDIATFTDSVVTVNAQRADSRFEDSEVQRDD